MQWCVRQVSYRSPRWSLDVLPEFDPEILLAEIGVLFSDLLHRLLLRLLHVLLVALVIVVMGRTFASEAGDARGNGAVFEVRILLLANVFTAVVAYRGAAGAHDFVASAVFEYGGFALGALADDGVGASFFDLMTFADAVFLFELFAAHRDVGNIAASTTANFLAFGVAAAEFFVDFDGVTDGGEVAERTAFKVGEVGFPEFGLLLQTFELLDRLRIEESLSFLATKDLFAATAVHALENIAGKPD